MVNKDGGAHVDEKLQAYYEVLMSGKWALGITPNLEFSGKEPYEQGTTYFPNNAHLALMRQFAHEVMASSRQFCWHLQPQ
ncbi:MAG: hypothetical protein HUJ26_09735 [Planctomycetaceae bacterium]|nr:hypothetical protein [Planctomycetaceae bacterium]